MDFILLILLGSSMGALSALLGLGGGVLVSPLLPIIFSVTQTEAVATSLMTIFFIVIVNSYFFHRRGLVVWQLATVGGVVSAAGAFLAGRGALQLSEVYIQSVLGTTLIIFAGFSYWKFKRTEKTPNNINKNNLTKTQLGQFSGIGLMSGMLSGITGVGSGTTIGPTLLNLRLVPNEKVVPTVNGVMILTTFFGALAYSEGGWNGVEGTLGAIQVTLIPWLIIPAWGTAHLLRPLQERISEQVRSRVLTALLFILGLRVLASALGL